jgi:lipopolysaccharide/colanic/teichoic acid biosynthesis glycosyltransferase
VLKRALDVCIAGLSILALLPIFVVAGILVRLDSEGPAIYRQLRVGRGFRPFHLLKFRTMRSASHGLAFTFGNDPRITRVGRCLRWLKFDELPQLWNVLVGDMSLVGPRPVVPELTEEFRSSYEILLVARPGLTDPATVKYCREAELLAQISDPMWFFKVVLTPDKLNISLDYLSRATVASDLLVLLQTARALLPSPQTPRSALPLRVLPGKRAAVLAFPSVQRRALATPAPVRPAPYFHSNLVPMELNRGDRRIGFGDKARKTNRR